MPIFVWKGTSASGKPMEGEIEVKDAVSAFHILRSQGVVPNAQSIKQKNTGINLEIKIPGFGDKVKEKEIVIFTRQFATMIDAGLPIVKALDLLGVNSESKVLSKAIIAVKQQVEAGRTLSESLNDHPKIFDVLFVNMIKAGEDGGILDTILERLSTQIEKSAKLKREVKTAMIYPSVVVAAAAIVTTVLLVFVIPTFGEMFRDFGKELPLPTQIVLELSDILVATWYYALVAVIVGGYLFKKALRNPKGQAVIHPLALKLPVFGDIIKKVAIARFSRTLGTMLGAGVPILDALQICSKTAGNIVIERDVQDIRVGISSGKSITEPMEESVIFPSMVTSMVGVGESTGALDAMLSKIADFYEDEVENAVGAMKQLIEPIMILVLGTLIGGLVIAMYLPIFKLGDLI